MTKATAKPGMTDEHKQALAQGRAESRAVKAYIDALEASKVRPRQRSRESLLEQLEVVKANLATARSIERIVLLEKHAQLVEEIEEIDSPQAEADISDLEKGFIEHGLAYSERKGIRFATWRMGGVPASVLKAAGIHR